MRAARSISPRSPTGRCCASGWRAPPLVELAREAAGAARAAARGLRRSSALRGDHGWRSRAARALLQQRAKLPAEIKQRSERLRELAKYRNAGDTVPTAESLGRGSMARSVLLRRLWEIYRVLLR